MTSFRYVLWTSLYFLLALLFARYSPFYLCLFLFSFAFLSPFVLASLPNLLCVFLDSLYAFYFLLSLVALSLSVQPIFTQNPLSTNLNHNWYRCFASLIEKYWELLFNYNLTSLIPAQNAGCKLLAYAASCALHCHLPVFLGARWWGIQVTYAIAPAHYLFSSV